MVMVNFGMGRDNLVENNYFEQIYDVAMTNQGPEACLVKDINGFSALVLKKTLKI